ncbi:unnamed protein product [Phytomonas sp. EM1]|nr:unnamed protein product [Phytomonas sp. EM1]|eukprot:CCW60925.1 unnamed protein product [Phytomonas sp. isolate EM1]
MQIHFESSAPSLTKDDVERFSRQMLCDNIGAAGMERIRRTRVACIGVGGLGSMVALYLVAGGIGKLTVVDFDQVELSNMHRQVIHTIEQLGVPKVVSAQKACLAIDPKAAVEGIQLRLSADNAERLLRDVDVVVDATDNAAARYLINDAAMRLRKPLVSGSAVRWDGQLSVYGYQNAPCYRCLFPQPPPAETVNSCSDVGVVGPVPGMIGCLQALEVLKLAAQAGSVLSGRMLIFDGLRMSMKVVELRPKQANCAACGGEELIKREIPLTELMQRERPEYGMSSCATGSLYSLPGEFCVCTRTFFERWGKQYLPWRQESLADVQSGDLRVAARDVSVGNVTTPCECDRENQSRNSSWTLCIDVRPRHQYDMAHLPRSFSLPLSVLQQSDAEGKLREQFTEFLRICIEADTSYAKSIKQETNEMQIESRGAALNDFSSTDSLESCEVFFICRRGVSSVKAMHLLLKLAHSSENGLILINFEKEGSDTGREAISKQIKVFLRSVNGGLNAYHREVDSEFPFY